MNIRFDFSKIKKKPESQIGICHKITSRGSSITGKDKQQKHSPLLPVNSSIILMKLIQHEAYFLIHLNADSLYPFACWSICLLCLLILMLIILMLILIESKSMLIVYWLGDRKLINALNIILNNYVIKRKSAYRYAN